MFNAHSTEIITGPYGEREEHDRFRCNHCGAHKRLKPGETPEFTCKICMDFICGFCANRLMVDGCTPQEKYLEDMERAITRRLGWERNFREMGR
jgi:hypothetical protein